MAGPETVHTPTALAPPPGSPRLGSPGDKAAGRAPTPALRVRDCPVNGSNDRLKRVMLGASLNHFFRETTMSFSIESKLGDLLDNETTKAILEKHLPGISTHPQIAMGKGFALSMVAKFSGGLITDELLGKVDTELKAL
jgi:hypothetical protein